VNRRRILLGPLVASLPLAAALACGDSKTGAPADGGDQGASTADAAHEGNPFAYDTGATPDTGNVCTPHRPPKLAADTATLSLDKAQFGDAFPDGGPYFSAWKDIGYNLDDLCTTATDTNVCTPPNNGSRDGAADGNDGIDNSFGANVVPLLKQLQMNLFTSSAVTLDISAGTGVLVLSTNGGNALSIPLTHAVAAISTNGGGTLAAVIPTATFLEQVRAFAGRQTTSQCTSAGTQSILQEISQSSDILADGTQSPTVTCSGITLGVGFAGSQAASSPMAPIDPCDQ
jgi:hypothetical protein